MTYDLDAIATEFRTVDQTPSTALSRAVERGTRQIRRGYMIGAVILAFLTAVSVHVLATERDIAAVLFAVSQIGVAVATLVWHHVTTSNVLGASTHTTRAFLELEIARTKRRIATFKFLVWELAFFVPLVAARQFLQAHALFAGSATVIAGNLFGIALPYLLLALIVWRVAARRKKFRAELARLEEMLTSVNG